MRTGLSRVTASYPRGLKSRGLRTVDSWSPCARLLSAKEAIALHDAAHDRQDADLHALARRLMPVAEVEHIGLDALDETATSDAWAELPLALTLKQAVVCEVEGDLVAREALASFAVPHETGDVAGEYAPVYDLCLVRRTERVTASAEGLLIGKSFVVGEPLEHGVYKFPACAVRFEGKPTVLHVTKDGTKVCDLQGQETEGDCLGLPEGIWLAVLVDGEPRLCDAFRVGHEQTVRLRLAERLQRIPEELAADQRLIEKAEGLLDLPAGRWLIRWVGDLADFPNPQWFLYDAQTVRPGQYVDPRFLDKIAEQNTFALAKEPTGIPCQVHIHGECVWLFGGGCAIDRSKKFPPLCEALKVADSLVVLGTLGGEGLSHEVVKSLWDKREPMPENASQFTVIDLLFLNGEDLHDRPQAERLAALEKLDLSHELLRMASFAEAATADKPELDDRSLSRLWVDFDGARIEQGDEAVRFWYRRHYDGAWTPEECNEALNGILSGKRFYGVSSLDGTLGELRRRYRAADRNVAGNVVSKALVQPGRQPDLGALVRRVFASGELRIEAPPDRGWLLGLDNAVVSEALQCLTRPQEIEDLGVDPLIEGAKKAKWEARQEVIVEADSFAFGPPATVEWSDPDGAMVALDKGTAILGVQKHDFHEVFLLFDSSRELSGRYTWSLVALDEGPIWFGTRPQGQTPYLLRHDRDADVAKAREDGGWIAWNPQGIRLLAETILSDSLPLNWESHLECFENAPFVDFSV